MQYTIREYGHITASGELIGMDFVPVGHKTFQRLRELALSTGDRKKPLFRFSRSHGQETLQVLNYVGVLGIDQTTQIEILPKISSDPTSASESRAILWRMLKVVTNLVPQENDQAALHTLPNSWLESLTSLVLKKVSLLVRSGIKSDYIRREERATFLKGQLKVAKQMRARPGTEHKFSISYDRYLPDRAENRLLKSALCRLEKWTTSLENKRLCREYIFVLDDVLESNNVESDLRRWRNDRGMAHYQPLLPWIRLILTHEAPLFSSGKQQGISLLFPMERLFEEYVFKCLKKDLSVHYKLQPQASSVCLLTHEGKKLFRLVPDGLITYKGINQAVLDTKWKMLDERLRENKDKYKLSQGDFYQMFAYGMKYLSGKGELFLIYPNHTHFNNALECFEFDEDLRLWALPFNLSTGQLVFNKNWAGPDWHARKSGDSV
jgi:5-methylcytosine-specific restriction enzyme subunit McrC